MEHDTAAEKDDFYKIQMENFANQVEETIALQLKEISVFRKLEKKSEEMKTPQVPWSSSSRVACKITNLKSSTPKFIL